MGQADFIPTRNYKKRTLKELAVCDQTNIIHAYLVKYSSQKDVAQQYKVSSALVHRLCSKYRKDPAMFSKLQAKEEKQDKIKKEICKIASDNLAKSRPIWKAETIKKAIQEEYDEKISIYNVCRVLH